MNLVKDTIIGNIADDWVLGEFSKDLKIQGRIGWKGYTTSDLVESGPIVVGGTEIKSKIYLNLNNVKHLSREKYVESPEIILKDGDVLLVTRGNLGEVGYYHSKYGEGTINPSVIILKDFKGDSKYLFYYLISKQGNHQVLSLTSGSSIPAIYQSEVNTLLYPKPPLQEQKAIANVLTAFDDKIELLQQQNTTLETIAQTIFKQWFGKYQIGGELPEGWRFGEFGDLFHLLMGLSPKGDTYNFDKIGLPLLNGAGDYDNGLLAPKRFSSNPTRVNKIGDLIFCIRGTIGNLVFAEEQYCLGRGVAALSPKKPIDKYFNYITLSQIIYKLTRNATGSVILGLSKDDIKKAEIMIPTRSKLDEFGSILKPIFDKKEINLAQIQSLTKTRDTLLPKLMCGQVRVKM